MSTPPKTLTHNPNQSWTVVSHRRNRKRPKSKSNPNPDQFETLTLKSPIPWTPLDSQPNPILQSKLLSKLQSSLSKLKSSQFYNQFLSQLQCPQIQSGLNKLLSFNPQFDLIIYGIGSIDSYETPRLQLSLALLILDRLKPQISSIEVFDPIISTAEQAVIEQLGVAVMGVDERGRREVKVPTLFFMPHCEVQLYDNLLDANWGCENLNKMVILGNSFGEYERYVEEKKGASGSVKVEEAGKRVIGSRRFVREVRLEGGEDCDDDNGFFRAFHDISWHFFDVGQDVHLDFV
ncbi:protein SENSITIVITY TO RED LIGHT REDUCED 1 [Asparagus officinalis]|uniref:protein SENSITIVITY TO RED LIGHT REDUCED 1 n=1 Tax=Asparagus officinalis TaxID=4686 RepID=UPI00098E5E81|nr:protein SENSITIVITY TO RED LIGHT REDUCED 1 [Asparagus officinalis]